jgi:hypothetical protein
MWGGNFGCHPILLRCPYHVVARLRGDVFVGKTLRIQTSKKP